MKKRMLWFALVGILCACSDKSGQKESPTVKVCTETVRYGNDYRLKPYVGQAEANTSTSVSFPTAGTLGRVYVEEGQAVKAGQLLAEINPTLLQKALQSAEALLSQARDAYNRMKYLHETNSLPEIQWVETQSKLSQAQSAYDIARKNLEDCRLLAPISGVVGCKFVQTGETVMPAQPVMTVLDINKVKVNVSIPEKEIGGIHADTECGVYVAALDGASFKGGRIVKSVQSDPMTHTYPISIHVDNPGGRLLPGMVCDVTFGQTGTPALSVPITAVMAGTGDSRYVWVVENGTAKRKDIRTGMAYGGRIVVTEGLQARDSVIVKGMQKLSNGSKVSAL
ncbi:efflux RND transporter periplasmic adaptor subunit [Bacteroides thetaiotaomicron]|jgi:RND family efflux transporter MFP subunit|uniref:efflux RND transporter periplasmic adaptor subunit n=1 Tax=Bacteroides thetaiotaomicron TaxID=818 RepID=UPI0039C048EA